MNDSYSEFIQTIKDKCDIVSILSQYVDLKKRGGKYWACCPFHHEKTASFSVSPDKGLFYCFGCHVGGDALGFVQKMENLSFHDTLCLLAERYGIPIPSEHKSLQMQEKENQHKLIHEINSLAVDYFKACLHKTKFGQHVQAYLKSRNIDDATIEKFSIGAALTSGDSLYKAFLKKNISKEDMLKARLIGKRDGEEYYDFFRSRLMIPIKNPRGKVVGFGGRIVGSGNPKYLNTAESEFFNKRYLLYGLDVALDSIKKSEQVIVVEGYMDAICLHANGFTNTVASLGTAFSDGQAKLISRIAKTVVFCYDSDLAGLNATARAIPIATKQGIRVRALSVTDAKDPDEYITKFGREKFSKLLKTAQTGFDFQKKLIMSRVDFSNLAGKVEVVSNMLPIIEQLDNQIEIKNSISILARELVIDEDTINSELNKYLANKNKDFSKNVSKVALYNQDEKSMFYNAQKQLLQVALKDVDLFFDLQDELGQVVFQDQVFAEIFEALKNQKANNSSREELFSVLTSAASSKLAMLLADDMKIQDAKQVASDCIKQMKKSVLQQEYDKSRNLAAEYERLGDSRFLQELAKSQQIKNEIKQLF